ncbi:P-loop NTPase fold protein [Pseudanabaena sp. ABRG5-3]|uniref:P-loop NTPase fold protein n=1 Tax=Pseudanabaena sp. ABRG5-3 TaxID=685565 RepID=UPI000DC6E45E|nr:P-loop NTPase fold protein [Pseudanabaena sp. ABRG5-3]BBC22524.1 WD-repeat protein [Pseudanabaena sp. ABRG5-3]
MDAEFLSEAQPMQQQMQQQMQEMYFEEEAPEESDSADEDVANPVIFARLESEVNSVAFSPDGRKIIAGLSDGSLQLFDAISGKTIGEPFQGHSNWVMSVAFSPDGKAIVSGSRDTTLWLWDLQGNQIGDPFIGHSSWVKSVAFSPDGKAIVSGSDDGTLRLWDLQGNQIGDPFIGHSNWVMSVAFSPDGKAIISGGSDRTLRLWDLQGNQIANPFRGHVDSVMSVAFSPDGKAVVSGGDQDRKIQLWDLQGNQIANPFRGHDDRIWSVAFKPDGKAIISGSWDGKLRLWDLQGNQIEQTFQGDGSIRSAAFSPDGKAVVSGSNNTIRLWTLDGNPIANLANRSRQIEIPQGVTNDSAQGEDCLNVQDEIEAMATVLMLRSLQPPIAVGILGSWGSGKSFGMYLIQQRLEAIRKQELTKLQAWGDPNFPNDTEIMSPYVGHIYQISFNAWTYAKSDLWASLMQEIFYELNRQITLEQQIGIFLCSSKAHQTTATKYSSTRNIDRLIYNPLKNLKTTIQTSIEQSQTAIAIFSLQTLNLWIFQFFLHVIIFLLIILSPILYLFYWLVRPLLYLLATMFDHLATEKLDLKSKIRYFPFIEWLLEQAIAYYFPDYLKVISYNSLREKIESFLEHLLFLILDGFPKRLKDSKKNLEKVKKSKSPKSATNFDSETALKQQKEFEQALLNSGDFWRVLYLTNDEERRAFIESNDRLKKFKDWKDPTSNSNYLWNTLDKSKQEEQQRLKQQEQELQKKEQELQRQLKSAEAEVKQQLANRKATALWTPIVKAITRLLFSKEEIEKYKTEIEKLAEAGKTTNETIALIRKVVTSWQGLIALFLMTLLIVLTLDPATRTAIFTATQNLLEQTGLASLLDRLIPTEAKNNLTELSKIIRDWFANFPQWMESIRTQIPSGVQVITAIAAAVTTLIPILKTLNNYLNSVQKEQAKIQSDREFLLKQKQGDSENLVKEVAQLKLQVAEQKQRVGLTANYASLMDFVSDRLQVDDYGKRLGLMQQVKQDLAALSDRLTDWQHNREELKKFFPRGPARVVLYIDDLDRCPPDRVVEVLESVQLLLNTKLFIVVLGIDDRYIARALEQVYEGVLKRGGKPSGLDYLEKIIQIPYRMRPISSSQIDSYLRAQTKIAKPQVSSTPIEKEDIPTNTEPQEEIQEAIAPLADVQTPDVIEPEASAINTPESLENSQSIPTQTTQAPTIPTPQAPTSTDETTFLETIAQTIEFEESEFQLLVNCCKHVDITPRTAKRLINIYKILQIIWSTRSQKGAKSPTDTDKRIAMSFLALSGRYPTYMRNLFEEIDVLFEETISDDSPLEIYLEELLETIKPKATESDRYAHREWRKFTSDIKRMLEHDQDCPTKLKIDREIFDLMLSFCFVGDIGYDPDDFESKV